MEQAKANAERAMFLMRGLEALGVRDFVLSPGSRNTPLILALEALVSDGASIRLHRILDERSAGFFALGLGRSTGQPAALVCTSGTAGAHYLPAVIEADQSYVPMLVLTADRPEELHGCGALQTVEQEDFFGSHTRLTTRFSAPGADESQTVGWVLGAVSRSVDAAVGARPGPVHLNIPFREPLWDADVDFQQAGVSPSVASVMRSEPTLGPSETERLRALMNESTRVVIVAGPKHGPRGRDDGALREQVTQVARERGWPVIAEPDSGLRFGAPVDDVVMGAADSFLRDSEVSQRLAPELVIRIGQTPTSKPVRHWLRDHAHGKVILVDAFGSRQDPDHTARELVVTSAKNFIASCVCLGEDVSVDPDWLGLWRAVEAAARAAMTDLKGERPWEGAVAQRLVECMPSGGLLHVANSMPIRDLDGFGGVRSEVIEVFSNRGANGIDGMLSTAVGEALGRGARLVAYAGDLTALHDLSGFLVAKQADVCVTLVVVDNRGGGIFEHLPISEHPTAFESNFITPHDHDIASIATALGARAHRVESIEAFADALVDELERPGLGVVVLRVDRTWNTAEHRRIWSAVGKRAREELGR
ncbi:MAG: 2-succinyl-5-enolpyruvyl-6-hydroxy-3-cyclohexene-1-carboxylic-acid synthase [Myxococcota bacterium]|nr:2-succinyl-5-enolpyruvyl-6-hydroxy-3-cyclohexene-1-carboxylic-acid synthase [Myxococcota bacterium]